MRRLDQAEAVEPRVLLAATAAGIGEVEVLAPSALVTGQQYSAVLIDPTHAVVPLTIVQNSRSVTNVELELRFENAGVTHIRTSSSVEVGYFGVSEGWVLAELDTPLLDIQPVPIVERADLDDGSQLDYLWGGGSQTTTAERWGAELGWLNEDWETETFRTQFYEMPTGGNYDMLHDHKGTLVTVNVDGEDHLAGFGMIRSTRYDYVHGNQFDYFHFRGMAGFNAWRQESATTQFTGPHDGFMTWNASERYFYSEMIWGGLSDVNSDLFYDIDDGFGVGAGDTDGDDLDELVVFNRTDSSWHILLPNQLENDPYRSHDRRLGGAWSTTAGWREHMTGDFNGDGLLDVYARTAGTGMYVGLSDGVDFNVSHWGALSNTIAWDLMQVVDMNGDGMSDILVRKVDSGSWYVALSNGSGFDVTYFGRWNADPGWRSIQAVDANGDGKTDLIGQKADSKNWYLATSTGTSLVTTLLERDTWAAETATMADFNDDGVLDLTYLFLDGYNTLFIGTWLSQADGTREFRYDIGEFLPNLNTGETIKFLEGGLDLESNGSIDVVLASETSVHWLEYEELRGIVPARSPYWNGGYAFQGRFVQNVLD